jgi:hypothetical protein
MASFAAILDGELARADLRSHPLLERPTVSARVGPDLSWWTTGQEPVRAAAPSWARTLGAPFPCSERELRAAFKRRAFATHPDRTGGSAHAFREAREALDAGLRELGARAGRARQAAVERYRHCSV